MHIFLDESGDLGFDTSKKGTSHYFTITLLVANDLSVVNNIKKAVKRTLDKKINHKRKNNYVLELKGTQTNIKVKEYFLDKMPKTGWALYSITLNKSRTYDNLKTKYAKARLYNFLVNKLILSLPKESINNGVNIVIDQCKNKTERKDFDHYILTHAQSHFSIDTYITIHHENSEQNLCLQATDLFCWGIQRNAEHKDATWLTMYKTHLKKHILYLK